MPKWIVVRLLMYSCHLRPSQLRTYKIPLIGLAKTTTTQIVEVVALILPE
jgi:hypothetical protein